MEVEISLENAETRGSNRESQKIYDFETMGESEDVVGDNE